MYIHPSLPCPVLCLPWFAGMIVQVYHMLHGLVAVSILTHVGYLHLPYLMNGEAVIAVIKNRRHNEHRIQHGYKSLPFRPSDPSVPEHHENRPGVVPGVALGKGITPFKRIERFLESAIPFRPLIRLVSLSKSIPVILTALLNLSISSCGRPSSFASFQMVQSANAYSSVRAAFSLIPHHRAHSQAHCSIGVRTGLLHLPWDVHFQCRAEHPRKAFQCHSSVFL
jgi:hypothetical protein